MQIHYNKIEEWKVTIVDTGLDTMTGGRIKRIQRYIHEDAFMVTYGDGVCDLDLKKLLEFHKSHGKIATLTSVILKQDKGTLDIGWDNSVKAFREKENSNQKLINAGYMVFNNKIFDYLKNDETILERWPMEQLAKEGELMSYQHNGFWQCMDTLWEKQQLEHMLHKGKAPWKVWE